MFSVSDGMNAIEAVQHHPENILCTQQETFTMKEDSIRYAARSTLRHVGGAERSVLLRRFIKV